MVGVIVSMSIVLLGASLLLWVGNIEGAAAMLAGGIIGNVIAEAMWRCWVRMRQGRWHPDVVK